MKVSISMCDPSDWILGLCRYGGEDEMGSFEELKIGFLFLEVSFTKHQKEE
jgi:hypothetical protein